MITNGSAKCLKRRRFQPRWRARCLLVCLATAASLGHAPAVLWQSPALAQGTVASGLSGFASPSNAPIDVQADSLTINDVKKTAIYKGNVVAIQGDYTLKTTELEVFYTAKEQTQVNAKAKPSVGKAATPAQPANDPNGQQIKKIKARNKVVMTSNKDQTVTGDQADFDVQDQKIVISGNVFLKQGENILKGERLLVDLKTGESTMQAKPSGGRVITTLHPLDKNAPAGAPTAPEKPKADTGKVPASVAKPPEISGWSSSTAAGGAAKKTPSQQ